jgi:hypothetical protein
MNVMIYFFWLFKNKYLNNYGSININFFHQLQKELDNKWYNSFKDNQIWLKYGTGSYKFKGYIFMEWI